MAKKSEAATTSGYNELIIPLHPRHEPTETTSPVAGSQSVSSQSGSQPGSIDGPCTQSSLEEGIRSIERFLGKKINWTVHDSDETLRRKVLAGGYSEYLYVFGGDLENTIERYDLIEEKWETVCVTMPDKRTHFGVATLRNEAWLVGGTTDQECGMHSVISFNHSQKKFCIKSQMPTARHSLGVAELDDQLYAVGGISKDDVYDITEVFRPGFGWRCIGFMNKQRYDFGIASHRGKLYVAGGNDGTSLVDVVEEFTVTNDTWQLLNGEWRNHSKLLHGRMHNDLVSGGLLGLDKLYAVGTAAPEVLLDITWNKVWHTVVGYRFKRDRENICAIGHIDWIFLIGGDTKTGELKETVKDVDRYDTRQNTWSKIGPMGKARTRAGVTMLKLDNQ